MAQGNGLDGGRRTGELTFSSIGIGLVIAVVMTAANVYLGLYAGMTVSASIPAAVLGMGAYRLLGRRDARTTNIVQTIASSGESLAAGAIFTIPALVLVGAWQDFRFWPTTLIVLSGGLLGIAFMVPLRRLLMTESPELTYPEGVACAEVLKTGERSHGGGVLFLLKGFGLGAAFKLLAASGLGLLSASLEWAGRWGGGQEHGREGGRVFFFGSELSPALLSVGFITGLGVASQVFLGGAIAWVAGLPLLALPAALASADPLEAAWGLWSGKIRYLGVGAMVVGGLWSIFSIRKGIAQGLRRLAGSYRREAGNAREADPTQEDMPGRQLLILLAVGLLLTFGVYWYLLQAPLISLATTALMALAAFVFVGVSSYIVGLVGSSNNPVSGMTISALLGTAAFFLVLGFKGDSAVLATLGVAAVVCCAACSAGDCSQDLKTGHLVGSTPRKQQYAEIIGAVVPAMVIAPVLTLLHHAYGIGDQLKAPQATLFASLTSGIFGQGEIPFGLVGAGAGVGIALIAADAWLKSRGSRFRLHPMPVAVGMYLPFTLSVPIFLGGLVRHFAGRRRAQVPEGRASFAAEDGAGVPGPRKVKEEGGKEKESEASNAGILLSSGLIAGESIMGVGIAAAVYLDVKLKLTWHADWLHWLSLALFLALAAYLARASLRSSE
jgi:putative OPT family oligopeptide transporter